MRDAYLLLIHGKAFPRYLHFVCSFLLCSGPALAAGAGGATASAGGTCYSSIASILAAAQNSPDPALKKLVGVIATGHLTGKAGGVAKIDVDMTDAQGLIRMTMIIHLPFVSDKHLTEKICVQNGLFSLVDPTDPSKPPNSFTITDNRMTIDYEGHNFVFGPAPGPSTGPVSHSGGST